MRRDTNPEVEALRLDPLGLLGMHVDEIEARFAEGDVRLIMPAGPLPPDWPRDVRERTGPSVVDFRLETADGTFRRCGGFRWETVGSESPSHSMSFGYLYTRRPLASPRVRLRPIVHLHFDLKGVCDHASAALAENCVRVALRELDVEAGRCAPLSFERVFAQRLGAAFGLGPPGVFIELPDFELDAGWRSRERFTFAVDPPGFRLDDATGFGSLACVAEPDGGVAATPSRVGESSATSIAIPREGHRFVASDAALTMIGFMDLYGGDLRLAFRDGGRDRARRVRALLVASRTCEPEAESLPPGATIGFLLGSPLLEWAPAEDGAVLVEPASAGLRLLARGRAEPEVILRGRVEQAAGAAIVFAEIDEDG